VRPKVAFFYAACSDFLKSSTGVSTLILLWIREKGLTPDDVTKILRRMLQPEEIGRVTYGGQIIGRLGEMVDEIVKERDRVRAVREQQDRMIPFGGVKRAGGYGLAEGLDQILGRAKKGGDPDASQRQ